MKVTIAGTPGSGKSTAAREVARHLGYRHYSAGDFMRQIAKKRGMTLLELSHVAEKDYGKIDKQLDDMQVLLNKKDKFVIDSRLGFHFIPGSFRVFLTCNDREAARRIFSHLREEEKENSSLAQTLANIRRRKASEKLRYKKYYDIDIEDTSNFDLIVDTTRNSPEETTEKILKAIKVITRR